ncbi:MAG: NAD(P)/FAD-dependent oxidoreductase [Desulfocapsaceae bacterium]|nr:NAD(P)/FAD-dependent oxidoreductase [Desulfocapsaceae bacterium]
MSVPLLIIGSGLSGLAAAIRYARFSPDVLLLEKHARIGGLNSFFHRNGALIETGLHAITNYAEPKDKKAPLNQLFRQLKLNRKDLPLQEQIQSEICFPNRESLLFSNDFNLFYSQVVSKFPRLTAAFDQVLAAIKAYDPFRARPFISTRSFLSDSIRDPLLIDMILCPLMYYGSCSENDMDLGQFVIMFRAIFLEGMFRPRGTIKDLLDFLLNHYTAFGGKIRLNSPVVKICHKDKKVSAVELASGEVIECDHLLSTIGYRETLRLLGQDTSHESLTRLGFIESIFRLPVSCRQELPLDRTIIFYNQADRFRYERPHRHVDFNSGVICFPSNFHGIRPEGYFEIRSTHLADYHSWKSLQSSPLLYGEKKRESSRRSVETIEKITGNFRNNIVYEDTFTPLTVERFTAKLEGAIYGHPRKFKDGLIGYGNLFLAGTDQGYLGIVGSMLSGISMVNRHILSAL